MSKRIAESRRKEIIRVATRDAKAYVEAQLNYGEGAGNRRKILQAQIDKRMESPLYAKTFNEEVAKVDRDLVARKIENQKGFAKAVDGARKTVRTARRVEGFCRQNPWLIDLVKYIFGIKETGRF